MGGGFHIQLSGEFWAAIAGAIVGAAFGGIISYFLQKKEFDRQAKATNTALALSIFHKLREATADIESFARHVSDCRKRSAQTGVDEQYWPWLLPQANFPPSFSFEQDEKTYLLSLKDFELFNDVCDIERIHRAAIEVNLNYSTTRRDITNSLPAAIEQGTIGAMTLSDLPLEERGRVQVRIAEIDHLAKQIVEQGDKMAEDAHSALERYNSVLKTVLGYNFTLENPKVGTGAA